MQDEKRIITDEVTALIKSNFALTHKGEENCFGAVPIQPTLTQGIEEITEHLLAAFSAHRDRFAFEDISKRLQEIVVSTVRSGEYGKAGVLMDDLWERLENPDERKVCYVPFIGVALATGTVEIGNFRLQQMNDAAVDKAQQLLNGSIDNLANSPGQKDLIRAEMSKELTDYLAGTVCLVVEVSADTEKADQIALRDAVNLLDLFRFTMSALYPKERNIGVGLKGDGQPGIYRRYILPAGKSDGSFPCYRLGPFGDFEINEKALEMMDSLGVLKIAASLDGALTDLQVAALRSIHWVAESQKQRTKDHELVNLIVALETLFELENNRTPKTDRICEAAAVLSESDEPSRIEVFRRLRDACFYRGEVVHQGSDVYDYEDMLDLRSIVLSVVSRVIHRTDEFKSAKEVLAWVDQQKAELPKKADWKKPIVASARRPNTSRKTPHGVVHPQY